MSKHLSIIEKVSPIHGSQSFTDIVISKKNSDPPFFERKNDFVTSLTLIGSTPLKGSSRRRNLGERTKALVISSLRLSPPLRV